MALTATKRKNSPYWYARGTVKGQTVYESTGIPHSDRVRIPQSVKEYIEKREEELKRYGKKTFNYAATLYLSAGGSPKYLKKIMDEIGHMYLYEITQSILDDTAARLYPKCAPATRNRQFYTPFIAVWSHNSIGQNPVCTPIKWKRPTGKTLRQVRKPVSYEQAVEYINACPEPEAKVMFFLFWTARRPIEAFTLLCEDIMLDQMWAVHRETKTGEPIGFPLHRSLIPMLEQEVQKGGFLFRDALNRPYDAIKRYNNKGRIISQGGSRVFSRAVSSLRDFGITPYTARHTASTYLSRCVTQYEKDKLLGHSNTMSGHYVYVEDQDQINAINKLPDAADLGCKLCKTRAQSFNNKQKGGGK